MKIQNLLFFLSFFSTLSAQTLIRTEPIFPRTDEDVTIFFDATKGTGGLKDCNCDVYAHTGVITDKSVSNSDWKYVVASWGTDDARIKMTKVNDNLYKLAFNIRKFYNVPTTEVVKKLAFVFRNVNGAKEGKDNGGADIFYEVYAADGALASRLISPDNRNLLVALGQKIAVEYVTSKDATLKLTDNGTVLTQTTGRSLKYELTATLGAHTLVASAVAANESNESTFTYTIVSTTKTANPPAGTQLGANYLADGDVILALYAPKKQAAFVVGSFNDWTLDAKYQMQRSEDGATFWIKISGLEAKKIYTYQYLVDGTKIADPLSELILDPNNDKSIPAKTFPNLPAYPEGKTTGIVTVLQTAKTPYAWQNTTFKRPAKTDLVIYELLIRDFIDRHDYQGVLDSMNYLQRLGVNAIELMPVNEYDNNESWGYNPSFHGALDKYYGSPEMFKKFIDECHKRGIAVILDVVYNHISSGSPLAQLYNSAENPWLNAVATHPYNVFNDMNHESAATRVYIDQILKYWQKEYKIDGYRFDLSKGFTQKQSNDDSVFRLYDANRIAILKHYADVCWASEKDFYVILEHFAENSEEIELSNYGMMLWGNSNYNYNEASMGYWEKSDFTWSSYKARNWKNPNLVTYMESHDEERLMYKNVTYGSTANPNFEIKNTFKNAIKRQELVSAFFYTIPGAKMLWQFGEIGYDYSIDFNGRVGNKPIKWDYFQVPERRRLYDITRALIHLKNTQPAFRTTNFDFTEGGTKTKALHVSDPSLNVTVIGNFSTFPEKVVPNFQTTGKWYNYITGDSINITNAKDSILLLPSEYRVYLSKKVVPPSGYKQIVSAARDQALENPFKMEIYPNPIRENAMQVVVNLDKQMPLQIEILTILGSSIWKSQQNVQGIGNQLLHLNLPNLMQGTYFLKITSNGKMESKRFVVAK